MSTNPHNTRSTGPVVDTDASGNSDGEAEEEGVEFVDDNTGDVLDIEDIVDVSLKTFVEGEDTVPSEERTNYLFNLFAAYLDNFTVERKRKVFVAVVKKEVFRRWPGKKGIGGASIAKLLDILRSDPLPQADLDWLKQRHDEIKALANSRIDAAPQEAALTGGVPAARITADDRLRLIEAFCCDEAKAKFSSTQDCYRREQLDARRSGDFQLDDYFATVSEQFNDPEFLPKLQAFPELHDNLSSARDLPLKEYRTTRSSAKDKFDEMRNSLHHIVRRWELSGSGSGQRDEDDPDYGTVGESRQVDGDDRKNFLPHNNDNLFYLLYFWQRLEDEQLLNATMAKLPSDIAVDSDNHASVSAAWRVSSAPTPRKNHDAIASALDRMSDTFKSDREEAATARRAETAMRISEVASRREANIAAIEDQADEIDLKMAAINDEDDPIYQSHKRRKLRLEERARAARSQSSNQLETPARHTAP
ncbi:MAG: hypothetical protein SGARI_000713 [Bacillariaceae sp.]